MKKELLTILLTSLITISLLMLGSAPIVASSSEQSPCDEVMILSDAGSRDDGGISTLYWVCLDDDTKEAILTPLPKYSGSSLGDGEIPLDVVAAIAASPDGTKIYAIDNDTSAMGIYDLSTSPPTWNLLPNPVRNSADFVIKQIALAACEPDTGTLYVVSNFHNRLFTVDTATGITTPIDFISGAGDTAKNDIVFNSTGTLYLYNNLETQHLYTLDPATAIATSTIAVGPSTGFNGLAVRDNGASSYLVGSDNNADQIVVFNPNDSTDYTTYDAYLNSGERFDFWYGDMTIGHFEEGVQEIVVPIDIKPTSCPNPLNFKSKGVLPVAILGTEEFDVTQIDLASINLSFFGPGSDPFDPIIPPDEKKTAYEDVATPFDGDIIGCYNCTTAGPDGYLDLTLKFDEQAIVDALGEIEDGKCLILTFTGNLKEEFGGTAFSGHDVVRIINKDQTAGQPPASVQGKR
jgi:hypothetical protein